MSNNLLKRVLTVLIVRLKHAFFACLNSAFINLKEVLYYNIKGSNYIVFRRIKQAGG